MPSTAAAVSANTRTRDEGLLRHDSRTRAARRGGRAGGRGDVRPKRVEHSGAMSVDSLVPMPAAQDGRAVERIADFEQHPRTGIERLETPTQAQPHAARRIEQRFLQRDRDRPRALEHLAASKHRAALLCVLATRAGLRCIEDEARRAPTAARNDVDERCKCGRDWHFEACLVTLRRHRNSPWNSTANVTDAIWARDARISRVRGETRPTGSTRSSRSCVGPRARGARPPRPRAGSFGSRRSRRCLARREQRARRIRLRDRSARG